MAKDNIWVYIVLGLIVVGGGGYILYTRQQTIDAIVAEANNQGVDENLALAIAEEESGFAQIPAKDFATTGSWGIFQMEPGAASDMNGSPTVPAKDFKGNPALDIRLGVSYIKWLLREFNGNQDLAIQAYNAGIGTIQRGGSDPVYLAKINNYFNQWSAV